MRGRAARRAANIMCDMYVLYVVNGFCGCFCGCSWTCAETWLIRRKPALGLRAETCRWSQVKSCTCVGLFTATDVSEKVIREGLVCPMRHLAGTYYDNIPEDLLYIVLTVAVLVVLLTTVLHFVLFCSVLFCFVLFTFTLRALDTNANPPMRPTKHGLL